ncbi:MAG: hypothetical protein AABX70_01875 [Nanoarchaeota archaeon]
MLDQATSKQILEFVRQKPRTIQEIAHLLDKNWRTANRYVEQIALEGGQIAVRTFREGSPGALKLAYWNALEIGKGSAYQERLLQKIVHGTKKEDFSPFEIYQFVPESHREAYLSETEYITHPKIRYDDLLLKAQHQLLFFSGNLSWMELGQGMKKTIEQLAERKVSIKVLTRVDITSQKNTSEMLALNQRAGWDAIEVRHCEQPLRAVIIDDYYANIKEVLNPQHIRELKKKTYIFYKVQDPEWVNWLQKVFWHLWNQSIDAQKRLEALKTLQSAEK